MNVRDQARSSLWLVKLQNQRGEDGAVAPDHETSMNTTYNQLNSNAAIIDAEEGRVRVPILQAPPMGHQYKQTATVSTLNAGDEVLTAPPVIPAAIDEPNRCIPSTPMSVSFQPQADVVLPTPRSVSFQPQADVVPPTPRSVSFQPQADVVLPTPRSVSFQPQADVVPPTPRSVNFHPRP
jgi:hypothetical protein